MSTPAAPLYQYYQPPVYPGQTVGFDNNTDPKKAAANQRAVVQSAGDQLMSQDQQLAQQYAAQQAAVQQYLNPLEQANATGQGGYTPEQASQIQLTPAQQQAIKTAAGISAGAGTASAVGAAERAAAAAGGNPEALATYRARAAQTEGAQAGQASTGAEIAAQQAGSAGAQAVGNAQIAQENQGLNYLGNLQAQQGTQGTTEQALQQGAYGTKTSGTEAATGLQVNAAGLPTTTDKIIGGLAGAASAFLADGDPGSDVNRYLNPDNQDAIVGENGMEAVIEDAPKAVVKGASDPIRSYTKFMDDGQPPITGNQPPFSSGDGTSWWDTASSHLKNYLQSAQQKPSTTVPTPGQQGWNKTTPWTQLGTAVGKALSPLTLKPQPTSLPNGETYNVPYSPEAMAPSVNTDDTDDPGAPAMLETMADGGMGKGGEDSILDDYLRVSMLEDGTPPSTDQGVSMMAGGRMGSGFHWSESRPRAPRIPAGGYQPLAYRAGPVLADGQAGGGIGNYLADGSPNDPGYAAGDLASINDPIAAAVGKPQNGMQVGNAKIFTKPTLIRLEKEDTVVPLSYRPRAKVRPSAALPALKAGMRHRMYSHG